MDSQNLYTIIVDYKGGTYISQVLSQSIEDVLEKWMENFDFSYISKKTKVDKVKKKMKADKINCQPASLKGLLNVWCISLFISRKKSLLINIILTQT